jgi:hypothetical protein
MDTISLSFKAFLKVWLIVYLHIGQSFPPWVLHCSMHSSLYKILIKVIKALPNGMFAWHNDNMDELGIFLELLNAYTANGVVGQVFLFVYNLSVFHLLARQFQLILL